MPASVVDRVIMLGEQTRESRELAFSPQDYASKVSPADAQLAEYYERNAAAFSVPESARVEFLVLSNDAVAGQIKVSAEEARAYYEQNQARFATAEQRRASHILVKIKAAASQAEPKAARSRAQSMLPRLRENAGEPHPVTWIGPRGDAAANDRANTAPRKDQA